MTELKPEYFWNAMMEKFYQKVKEGRSVEPWKEHSEEFLLGRMIQEVGELLIEGGKVLGDSDKAQDELIDVANMCCFLWLKLEGEE